MKHYSNTEARKNFAKIINEVHYQKSIISIGKYGEAEVLMIPKSELDESLPISQINAASPSFNFLEEEPEIYSTKDLKKRYV